MSLNNANVKNKTLENLLNYQDERFIKYAYEIILGRFPDAEGLQFYLSKLKTESSKIEILYQLRNSKEGKSRKVDLPGLDEALKRQKIIKMTGLSKLLKFTGFKHVKNKVNYPEKITDLADLLEEYVIEDDTFLQNLTFERINELNPNNGFSDILQAISALLKQTPVQKLRINESDQVNALFYAQLAENRLIAGEEYQATELYLLSLLFNNTATAHHNLGDIALKSGKNHLAIQHYQAAIKLNSDTSWTYINLAKSLSNCEQHENALLIICQGIARFPSVNILFNILDNHIDNYWNVKDQQLDFLALTQDREKLVSEYIKTATYISNTYAKCFSVMSPKIVSTKLNTKRVLIIGLSEDILPQCFRYRIEQKIEQLQFAGYKAESVIWTKFEDAQNLINFNDLIIFYRVPAFPRILKLIEYANSLGKITFYEIDDLVFETFSVPPIESYGGQLSMSSYTNITKDIGAYKAVIQKCNFAIASTLPLLERLAPLTKSKIGYLHRNGLDKYSQLEKKDAVDKGYVGLFYGSGTLAHNTDFILEALPAITRILKEHSQVKLVIMGYLTLPQSFINVFSNQIKQAPFVKNIEAYLTYLSMADINLAVLHDDALSACKSELKWFEAATFSIPSVVSRTRNYLDVIKNGEDGFIVSGEHEWYTTLKLLIENPELRSKVGENAYRRVNAEYSISALSENIHQIMTNAISIHNENRSNLIDKTLEALNAKN